jgi:hypothetical protein
MLKLIGSVCEPYVFVSTNQAALIEHILIHFDSEYWR